MPVISAWLAGTYVHITVTKLQTSNRYSSFSNLELALAIRTGPMDGCLTFADLTAHSVKQPGDCSPFLLEPTCFLREFTYWNLSNWCRLLPKNVLIYEHFDKQRRMCLLSFNSRLLQGSWRPECSVFSWSTAVNRVVVTFPYNYLETSEEETSCWFTEKHTSNHQSKKRMWRQRHCETATISRRSRKHHKPTLTTPQH